MNTWSVWFLAWLAVGFTLLAILANAIRMRRPLPRSSAMVLLAWMVISAGAAEVTRFYLTIAPFPPLVWIMAGLGLAIVGAAAGLAVGWFIGGAGFGVAADIATGIFGALLAGWIEITCSYSYLGCGLAVLVVGSVFATLALRLYARSVIEKHEPILL